ncbi:spore coat associated protein CotJA [Peribacillus cavernae]|uniref:Spore coat associated protein CotJA n=1 Tax=Peribacillus cavernae TaxID=1674310 RepID=A0A433HJ53_9BACI|nr:spore coat associated protein CotJA [Peribacillus cavernae]RUQ28265.1 spore coat associated protein CotJA [Peribacillus cavernae]
MHTEHTHHFTPIKSYRPFHSPCDPCPPIGRKYYRTPPNLYMNFQPPNLEQFSPHEALMKGTLWKALYDYYENPYERKS